jgi:serine/threonine protein kinase
MGDLIQTFGPYVVLGELGEGAMGRVVQARHVGLNRAVALKVLRAGDLATSEARARFRTEAEATAALEHPHIVPVYEVGEHDGAMYLAMKLLPGGNLAERLAEAAIDPSSAAAMVRDVARAVAYAHRRGVLHRDLKPANILFDEHGRAHLGDFGLSKFLGEDSGLTRSYGVLGTPSYMAPEVARGGARSATTAADVWGLGAVLYEALAGRPPFTGNSVHEVLRRVAEEEVAPLALRSRAASRATPGGGDAGGFRGGLPRGPGADLPEVSPAPARGALFLRRSPGG